MSITLHWCHLVGSPVKQSLVGISKKQLSSLQSSFPSATASTLIFKRCIGTIPYYSNSSLPSNPTNDLVASILPQHPQLSSSSSSSWQQRHYFSTATSSSSSPYFHRPRSSRHSQCACRSCSSKSGDDTINNTADDNEPTTKDDNTKATSTTGGIITINDEGPTTPVEFQIPGSQSGSGKKLAMVFTCTVCDTRSMKQFSEHSYEKGVVLVRCPGCQNLHLIADRLGWFDDTDGDNNDKLGGWDIESALAKLGETVNVVNNDNVMELSMEDLIGKDGMDKLSSSQDNSDDKSKDDR